MDRNPRTIYDLPRPAFYSTWNPYFVAMVCISFHFSVELDGTAPLPVCSALKTPPGFGKQGAANTGTVGVGRLGTAVCGELKFRA